MPEYEKYLTPDLRTRYLSFLRKGEVVKENRALVEWALAQNLSAFAEGGLSLEQVSARILAMTEAVRKQEETIHRIEMDKEHSFTADDVAAIMVAFADAVNRHVADVETRRAISNEMRSIINGRLQVTKLPNEIETGNQDLVEVVLNALPAHSHKI